MERLVNQESQDVMENQDYQDQTAQLDYVDPLD